MYYHYMGNLTKNTCEIVEKLICGIQRFTYIRKKGFRSFYYGVKFRIETF